jgi:glycosyltransferase involved in cell wall biosynthesis
LIIAHWWIPLGLIAALLGKTVNVICHGTDLHLLHRHRVLAYMTRPFARRVIAWRCVSHHLAHILKELYPFIQDDRISVAPMPVSNLFSDLKLKREPGLIISAGGLVKNKRFNLLIRTVVLIRRTKPNVRLVIYGEGPEHRNLQDLINDCDAGSYITLAGSVSRDQLAFEMNRASLFVLLSQNEGYGLVLAEANACGCPTIATDGDGKVDVAHHIIPDVKRTAWSPGDEKQIAGAILEELLKVKNAQGSR